MASLSFTPFVPLWNIEPSWNSSIWFYPKQVLLLLSSYILPSTVPILFFSFPAFLCLPLFLVPWESLLLVILLYLVVYLMYGQSNTIFFAFLLVFCSVGICFIHSHNSWFEKLTGYMTSKYVIGVSLQTLGVNFLSVYLFAVFHTHTIWRT